MAYKTSAALLAAIVVMAGPALAQEAATETVENAQQQAADSVTDAAEAAAADVQEAADDAAAAVNEAVNGAEPAADAAAEAAADAATADPAAEADATATDQAAEADTGEATGDEAATTDEAATGSDTAASQDATAAEAPADTAAEAPADAAETPAEPAADAPADATAEAAPAADAAAEPQVGAYYLKATHGDWTLRCIKAEEGQPDPCELYQLLKDDQGNSVAEVTMIPLVQGEAAAGATIVAPLETDLVRGLGLQIDSAAPRGYPFNFCAPVGCVSRMGFDAGGLSSLKRGNVATVSLLPFGADPENPVELPMSLTGFTAAFTELEGIVADARAQLEAQGGDGAAAEAEAPAN